MKRLILSLVTIYFVPMAAFSQTKFELTGFTVMRTAVLNAFVKSENKANCPNAGYDSHEHLFQIQDNATSSMQVINSLVEKNQPGLTILERDGSKCGSCQQVNQVAMYVTSEPVRVSVDASCNDKPTVNIQATINHRDINSFVEATLTGRSVEGKKLFHGCPDPCSLYSAFAVASLEGNKRLINLTTQCGQPRNGSLIFAKYKFSSGLIHKWTCQ